MSWFFAIFFSTAVAAASPPTFLESIFDQLDLSALQERRTSLLSSSASKQVETQLALTEFFLSESCRFDGKIHCEKEWLNKVVDRCEASAVEDGLVAGLCLIALVEKENLGVLFLPWTKRNWDRYLSVYQKTPPDTPDRLYVEGRIYSANPGASRSEVARGLLAWESLKVLRPDIVASHYWSGKTHWDRGEEATAKKIFLKGLALRPHDRRIGRLLFPDGSWRKITGRAETPSFGVRPGFFYQGEAGFGLAIHGWDDRLWDRQESASVSGHLTSRGNVAVHSEFTDAQWVGGTEVNLQAGFAKFDESDFGAGMQSVLDTFSEVKRTEWTGRLGFTQSLGEPFFFSLGWEGTYTESKGEHFLPVESHMGPWASIAFDTRDNRRAPWRGTQLSLGGYFPTADLGSAITFQQWDFRGEQWVWFFGGHLLRLAGTVEEISEQAPYSTFKTLSGSFRMPAVRFGRFRDRALGAAYAEAFYRFLPTVRVGPFVTTGAVAPNAKNLFNVGWKWGVGGVLESAPPSLRGSLVRVEVGAFGNEWIVQALLDASW